MGIQVVSIRRVIRDQDLPSAEVMNSILDEMERSIAPGRPVYVHCWGGRGRTGIVVGCYLVRQGLTGEEGLKKMDQLRQSASNGHLPSPKTDAQRDFVRSWKNWDRRALL